MPLGEGRHDLRVISDEGRRVKVAFNVFANELVQETSVGLRGRALHVVLRAEVTEELVGFWHA